MKMTGAQMAVKTLEKHGVKVIFGYPGASNAPLIDRLSFSSIEHCLTRNEQGAAHMASGYSRVTGKVGVCTATSGPGATNLITGIATAYMDSVPMVVITGQVARNLIGKDAFQEVDITGATLPFTKCSYLVTEVSQIQRVIDEAFHIASTGRPGPVLIDVPLDVFLEEYDFPEEDIKPMLRGYKLNGKTNEAQLKKVARAIKKAKKPVFLAGGGVVISDAVEEFRRLAELSNIPVVSTLMGIGVMPSTDEGYFGMIGSHGTKWANMIFNRSDLVIVMGSRLADRTVANAQGLEEECKVIHIDIDPAEIGKNIMPLIPVVGDIKNVITHLIPLLDGYRADDEWVNTAKQLRADQTMVAISDDTGTVNPRYFLETLAKKTNSEVYLTTEVGQNQLWCANHFNVTEPHHFLTSGGFGTMGYGLPAAIGASKAVKDGDADKMPVIAVAGDGSFQMDMPELGAMCQHDAPVKMVIFKNNRLGMVHELQRNAYDANYQAVYIDGSPDFNKIAEAYGIRNGYVGENSGVSAAIDEMLSDDRAYLLVVEVDPHLPTLEKFDEARKA